jgi:short-subunit dehydrogenase
MPAQELSGTTALVTGASRGFGRAIAIALANHGAHVIGVARDRARLEELHAQPGDASTPVSADATDPVIAGQLLNQHRPRTLVLNAGAAPLTRPVHRQTHLTRSRGAVVNNLSTNALAAFPLIPAYSISKAAAFNLTQSLRALLAGRGVRVHAVLTGPVDTDMTRSVDMPKASPESVARAIFEAVEKEEEDIFPDPMSQSLAESWRNSAAKALERQLATLAQAQPVTA